MTLPIALLLAAALADAYTSHRFFRSDATRELNPIAAKLFGRRPAFGEMLAFKAVLFGVIVYLAPDWMILAGAAAWAAAAVWNAAR